MRRAAAGRIGSWLTMLALLTVLTVSLGGCSGGSLSSVFSGSGESSSNTGLAPISFAPVIGPPPEVGDKLTGQLVAAAQRKNIPVVSEKGKTATYTVQGFLAQSNESKKEKFSYIWDVRDKSGNRVHRILGEEAVPAKPGAKPWASINQAALQKIAAKTATDLAIWLPKQSGVASARSTSATQKPPASASRRTASASAARKPISVLVPPVSGAPGDGRKSLTNAIRNRLRAKGIKVASTGGANVYKINGKVTMGRGKTAGTQSVKIDWQLLSSTGRDLGSVTQQSDVPKGSLDRSWGPAAVSAGNAAAAEIAKLIAKSRS
ncbi:hypothetical protein BMS3Bbin10_01472 [bacterium BMS3Bbin10]|nr:hypothetical protein BMS3Bbin10_01472 [bacterium BMS3Bbin10]